MEEAGLTRRFEAMGLVARPQPGGRCVLVDLPLGLEPFETLGEARRVGVVRFAVVDRERIKCLAPRALFYLPWIDIRGCRTAPDLEARIRKAWSDHLAALRGARDWLTRLGIQAEAPRSSLQWVFPLELGQKEAAAATTEAGAVLLPSLGPLEGVPLERPEDRVFRPDRGCQSAVDLELAVTTRMEELARYAERARDWRRRAGAAPPATGEAVLARTPPILVVGPRLAREHALQDSLRIRGFEVDSARSIDEAMARFLERSYELVLADARLDRADGIELIPALRAMAGIEEVPVVLLDDRRRESRRSAARSAGAAGYVARPVPASRLGVALARLIQDPRRRRFTRYRRALSVSWGGQPEGAITANVGRAGMLLRVPKEPPGDEAAHFEIHLPEMNTHIEVEGRIVSRRREPGRLEIGVHFRRFGRGSERTWIEFLRTLEPRPGD